MAVPDYTPALSAEQTILLQLQQMPANLQQQVLDFIGFLLEKQGAASPQNGQKRRKPSPARTEKPPKKTFGKYRGSLRTGLSLEAIDQQLTQLRDEWERPSF